MLSVTQPWLVGIRLQTGKVVCLHVQLILGFHLKLPASLPAQFWWVLLVWYKSLSARELVSYILEGIFFIHQQLGWKCTQETWKGKNLSHLIRHRANHSLWIAFILSCPVQAADKPMKHWLFMEKNIYIYYLLPAEKSCYQISFLNSSDLLYMRKKKNHFLYLQDLSVCSQYEKH